MKKIKFKFFERMWEINLVDKLPYCEKNQFRFGESDMIVGVINVAVKDDNGLDLPKDVILMTILHEIFHMILGTGAYHDANSDEPLVEWMARSMYNLMSQNLFDKIKL